MFRASHRLDVFRIVPLKAANKSDAKLRGEKRVFAVGFLTATPARVANNVNVGRVKVQADMLTRAALVFGGCAMRISQGAERRIAHGSEIYLQSRLHTKLANVMET